MEFKIKKITYKEFKDRFEGIKGLAYKRWNMEVSFGGWLKVSHLVSLIHNERKKCTYIAIVPIGYIDILGPRDYHPCYIVRFEGLISKEEITIKWLEENLKGIFEETTKWFDEYHDEHKDDD